MHLGFAGSRRLWPEDAAPERIADWQRQAVAQLVQLLEQLRTDPALNLGPDHFFVGVAQLASGADQLFAQACAEAGIPLRVVLPQARDSYLSAVGADGRPDFDASAKAYAEAALDGPGVIEERVVSTAATRSRRFAETNAEIVRLADLVITLQPVRVDPSKLGGTRDLSRSARRQKRPLCAVLLHLEHDLVRLSRSLTGTEDFSPPRLPEVLDDAPVRRESFVADVMEVASRSIQVHKERFDRDMRIVIWTHVSAIGFAAAALALAYIGKSSPALEKTIPWLLAVELVLLAWGLWTHRHLHRQGTTHLWADGRLALEMARSAQAFGPATQRQPAGEEALGGQHADLRYLYEVPLPEHFRALAKTLDVVHLQSTRANRDADHRQLGERYVRERLDDLANESGQIPYYRRELAKARQSVKSAHFFFYLWAGLAIAATAIKLAAPTFGPAHPLLTGMTSWLAIVLPVLAVAVMSIAGNRDLEAQARDYREMLAFLTRQRELLLDTTTDEAGQSDFLRFQAETEARLIAETVNWYYRRRANNPS